MFCLKRPELTHIPSPSPWSRFWNPTATLYCFAGCSLSWLLKSPSGRAIPGTLVFSGLSPAQGCTVCEDARTPALVLSIIHYLKGLALCLGSCKKLAQLRFSTQGGSADKTCFLSFSPLNLQETLELKVLSTSVEIDCKVSAARGKLDFTDADLNHFKNALRGPIFYFCLASHP